MSERSPKAREIMINTRQLLTAGGYKSFSYADLAERVGIRKASIHHHFPGKEDLVKAVVQEYRAEARAGMAAMDRQIDDPLAKVKGYAGFWSACIKDGTSPFCICVMLAVELPSLPAEIAAEVTGHFSDLSDWLAALLRAGEARGIFLLNETAEAEARTLMAGIHGAMLAARAFNNPAVFDQIASPLINKVVNVA
ncbi:TetR/AcrR family transcriptional regulator [Klebsiella variicola subsp. variicola]|uniref:TetR/AcrR family transcriptional regulator n=1 Tax=Klebsiella variicola TaxID=244366 RepID=UPI0014334393|nr:TetR/AcrR family transcriptional regulator [Klebsiella variicola]NKD41478.1 TetR/AcrR family transcriptional regulator [Escherichia coli]EMD1678293.1 TetR/AcrR family transcriptional regulator [Klebsiella variicola]MCH6141675.1 TetR/AcrR family transcriptional regulator [Klebsiella variicola]MCH6176520.1 TetR/AcrR family transcriptional regulator [Klebsiella variicola]MDE4643047.1 TetR/AcrR family transcriptional regulator [Klebsiella variicola]